MKNSLTPYMKHYGKTPEEQLEKNKKLVEEIEKALDEIQPKDLQKKVDELNKDNEKFTKNLNQVLE